MGLANKTNWAGGMNSQIDPSKRDFNDGYFLGINIRTRSAIAQSVKAPLDITAGLPSGKLQGIYTFDTTLLVFVAGAAYIKVGGVGPWEQISDFHMSTTADEIDCELVPSSTVNFIRSATQTTTQTDNAVKLGNPINASPQCLIVMDGENQPRVIFPDGTHRVVQTYAEWTQVNPEYVPVGRFPTYINGILYCVGRDNSGKLTQIFRSVTGQPLNFVILVNAAGNKISNDENIGGAPQLAHRVSYSATTAVKIISAKAGTFAVATRNGTWMVIPDFTNTIAAEPTFGNQFLFDIGAVGKNSIVDVLGDTTVVCRSGVRSFNGVQQDKWQGKNVPFSAAINNFISAQEQVTTATVSFDDYALYALSTRFGPGVLVFDMLQQTWVSIDTYKNIGLIKQFAKVQSGVSEELYFYTGDNKVYQAFRGEVQKAQVFFNELVPELVEGMHKCIEICTALTNIEEGGYVESLLYADRRYFNAGAQVVIESTAKNTTPTALPFNYPGPGDQVQTFVFNYLPENCAGDRLMAGISWIADAAVLEVSVMTKEVSVPTVNPEVEQVENFKLLFVGNDASTNLTRRGLNSQMKQENPDVYIGCGNHTTDGSQGSINTYAFPFWEIAKEAEQFYAVHGSAELATTNGEPWYQWLNQDALHYGYRDFGTTRVFFIKSGYNAAGTQVEPSNLTVPGDIEASEQFTWLRLQLASSVAKYNIVVMFDTIASSNPTVTARFIDIPFKSWGVDAIITGCSQMYERLTMDDGLVVFNVGTGGGSLYSGAIHTVTESRYFQTLVYGYLRLISNPLRLTFEFVENSNTVLDTFNL